MSPEDESYIFRSFSRWDCFSFSPFDVLVLKRTWIVTRLQCPVGLSDLGFLPSSRVGGEFNSTLWSWPSGHRLVSPSIGGMFTHFSLVYVKIIERFPTHTSSYCNVLWVLWVRGLLKRECPTKGDSDPRVVLRSLGGFHYMVIFLRIVVRGRSGKKVYHVFGI